MSVQPGSDTFDVLSSDQKIARLERALMRERRARLDAESIAERGLRESYLARSRLELLNRIATVANDSNDPMATLRLAAEEICLVTGWAIGHVLIRAGEVGDARLEGTDIWFAHDPDLMFPFADASNRLVAWPCASPPGQLFINPHPIWTPDIHALPGFTRSDLALRAQLRAGVAAPVLMGQELVAAIEFFATDTLAPDPELLELLVQVGTQAGRVFKRQHHARRLLESATRDPLTGLPNRTLFEARLAELFEALRNNEKTSLSLIYIDLDGFKLVNDTMGHQAGDQLLVAMAGRLRDVVKKIEGHFPEAEIMLARMGGDEFTVLVSSAANVVVAELLAEKIHVRLHPVHRVNDNDLRASASVGIAHMDETYTSPEALMRDADVAMYEAKYQGKLGIGTRTVSFDATMRAEALTRLELQSALRQAIEQRVFELHYQPIVQLNERNIVGFEALLRWPQPNGDYTAPDIFIPVAEECGLIVPLGTWVLREACRTAARWSIETGGDRTFFISVNVAPNQFQQPNFIDLVRDILMETGAHPRTIAMELTESAAVINPMRTAHMLEELRTMGVRVSLDDFGTGYSSLAHLQAMPFDALKIDGSFVINQDETNTNWTIVKAMTSMAEAMDLRVVAEGIETEFQRSRLQEIGCKFGQGWLFDRALPEADALALLTSVTTGDGVP